jgi:hypothetical protein
MTMPGHAAETTTVAADYDRAPVAPIESRPYVRDDFPRLTELLPPLADIRGTIRRGARDRIGRARWDRLRPRNG